MLLELLLLFFAATSEPIDGGEESDARSHIIDIG